MFLQAYNRAGLGPKSELLTLTTKEGKPGPPQLLKIIRYGRYLRVAWKPPSEPNGIITDYLLRIVNGTNDTVDADTRMYWFEGLEPETDYAIYINAKTSAGVGETLSTYTSTTDVRGKKYQNTIIIIFISINKQTKKQQTNKKASKQTSEQTNKKQTNKQISSRLFHLYF